MTFTRSYCNILKRPRRGRSRRKAAFWDDYHPNTLLSEGARSDFGLPVDEMLAVRRISTMQPIRTSFESPWRNGVTDRWVEAGGGTCWIR